MRKILMVYIMWHFGKLKIVIQNKTNFDLKMVICSDISDEKLNDSQDIEKNYRFHNQFNQEKLDSLLKKGQS